VIIWTALVISIELALSARLEEKKQSRERAAEVDQVQFVSSAFKSVAAKTLIV